MNYAYFKKNLDAEIKKSWPSRWHFFRAAKVCPGNMSRLFSGNGRYSMNLETAVKIAKTLDVSLDYLLREPTNESH